MRFSSPLVRGVLIKRYKRFLADVRLDGGTEVTAHCPNSGAMLGLVAPGTPVWLKPREAKTGLAWSWELAEVGGVLVGVNTQTPNRLVREAIALRALPEIAAYPHWQAEYPVGDSRIDFYLHGGDAPPCLLEVKNAHLVRTPGVLEFPDSVTARGAKHLKTLTAAVGQGLRAIIFYVGQRSDVDRFAVAGDIDPAYAKAHRAAVAAGVEVLGYRCTLDVEAGISLLDIPLAHQNFPS
jgi:sugar fermentation stimulation protein A